MLIGAKVKHSNLTYPNRPSNLIKFLLTCDNRVITLPNHLANAKPTSQHTKLLIKENCSQVPRSSFFLKEADEHGGKIAFSPRFSVQQSVLFSGDALEFHAAVHRRAIDRDASAVGDEAARAAAAGLPTPAGCARHRCRHRTPGKVHRTWIRYSVRPAQAG